MISLGLADLEIASRVTTANAVHEENNSYQERTASVRMDPSHLISPGVYSIQSRDYHAEIPTAAEQFASFVGPLAVSSTEEYDGAGKLLQTSVNSAAQTLYTNPAGAIAAMPELTSEVACTFRATHYAHRRQFFLYVNEIEEDETQNLMLCLAHESLETGAPYVTRREALFESQKYHRSTLKVRDFTLTSQDENELVIGLEQYSPFDDDARNV